MKTAFLHPVVAAAFVLAPFVTLSMLISTTSIPDRHDAASVVPISIQSICSLCANGEVTTLPPVVVVGKRLTLAEKTQLVQPVTQQAALVERDGISDHAIPSL